MTSLFEEKAAIREVIHAYAFRLDDEDFAGVAALFTPDGEWVASYSTCRGRIEIEDTMSRNIPRRSSGVVRKHFAMNDIITVTGDTATARTSYLAFISTAEGPKPVVAGSYEDKFVKRDGAWLIASRVLVHEIKGDLGLNVK